MNRTVDSISVSVALICAFALMLALCACGGSSSSSAAAGGSGSATSASASATASEPTSASSSSSSVSSPSPAFSLFGPEEEGVVTVEQKFDYSSGIHHAELVFEGFENKPMEIEIYSHSASQSAKKFCTLVDTGYYNGKPIFWILNEMYMRVGNSEQDNRYLVTGEYEESGVSNSNSLKRGVLALNRAQDGQQSDASSFFICMSDLSYLDNKYAAFAKITSNYEVVEEIAGRISSADDATRINIDDSGQILNVDQAPHILSIAMID